MTTFLKKKSIILLFILVSVKTYASDIHQLEMIIKSILSDQNVISARRHYELSIIDRRYQRLQWWTPSVILSNSLVYPYRHSFYDDLATGNRSSLDMLFPMPTGTVFSLGGSYTLTRNLLETSTLESLNWGFTQDLEFNISVSQSLNPWWIHSRRNPYSRNTAIQNAISRNDFNISIRNILFLGVETYIGLRKIERSIIYLNEMLVFYEELLQANRQLLSRGSISWREYEIIRMEKWQYESGLFALRNERASIQGELYRLTGMLIENVHRETLFSPENDLFTSVFINIQKEEINTLEESNLHLMNESLQMTRFLNRQVNAPSLRIEWGSHYVLPVTSANRLDSVWVRRNFDNNIRNNWSLTVALDLSVFLTPINRMQTLQFEEETRTINELLRTVTFETQRRRSYYSLLIRLAQEQIERLSAIAANDYVHLQEYRVLRDRGIITELEFKRAELAYREKQTLLLNLQDDRWLYTFINSFFF